MTWKKTRKCPALRLLPRQSLSVESLEDRCLLSWSGVPPANITPWPPAADTPVLLNAHGDAAGRASISTRLEVDWYRFSTPAEATYKFTADTPNSRLDPVIGIYDSSGTRVAYDDDSGPGKDSLASVSLGAGQTFFLGVTNYASQRSGGRYNWSIDGAVAADDFPNTPDTAAAISLSSSGSGSQPGVIETPGDVDMFRVVAPVSGRMAVTQSKMSTSALDSYLYLYDAGHVLLGSDDDSGGEQNSFVTIDVVAGATYFVEAAAYGSSTGAYTLSFTTQPDDFPDTFVAASAINLSSSGSGDQSGVIETSGDRDMFAVVAPVGGRMTVIQSKTTGSSLDSFLYLYDANQTLLGSNDDSGGTQNSLMAIDVVAGATYYIEAGGYTLSTGAYSLAIATAIDDFANTFAAATAISPSPSGSGTQSGVIEAAGDADTFRIVPPISGRMTITQTRTDASSLDTFLYVYNSDQSLLASVDDSSGTQNSLAAIDVVAGMSYYVQAAAYGTTIGAYALSFTTNSDDFLNAFASAAAINLSSSGSGSQSGVIEAPGDVDVFAIVTPVAGRLTVQQFAALGSSLDTFLHVYDADQNLIASNDDSAGTRNSVVLLDIPAGATYFIQAAGWESSTGSYMLSISISSADQSQLLLPDLMILADEANDYLYGWQLDTTTQPGSTLLRFSTAAANIGAGPLELQLGGATPDGMHQYVSQRIYDSEGGYVEQPAGTLTYHPEHDHMHFDNFARYSLRAVTSDGGVAEIVGGQSTKVSFCLEDVAPHDLSLSGAPQSKQYTGCGIAVQGLAVGWADVYHLSLYGQWVDVTGVAPGTYWLEVQIDPNNLLAESDESNNVTRIQIQLRS